MPSETCGAPEDALFQVSLGDYGDFCEPRRQVSCQWITCCFPCILP
jgi:hypothetical protein